MLEKIQKLPLNLSISVLIINIIFPVLLYIYHKKVSFNLSMSRQAKFKILIAQLDASVVCVSRSPCQTQ